MSRQGTIAAIATPHGRGGIGIVRVSGSACSHIAQAIAGRIPAPRQAQFCNFKQADNTLIDQGLALYFPAPHSFTGEDVLELHGHGGPVVMDLLLQRILELGARLARPGEFSERAFLNDKIDLTQAEGIADLIASDTAAAARASINSLQGVFSQHIQQLVEQLIELRVYVESAIDFAEEEIDFLSDGHIASRLATLQQQLDELLNTAEQGRLLSEGMTVVITGLPNAGKSSLLNQLSGYDSAIVTAIPGTTRDVLREQISIDGMPLHIIDTAGLRDSDDPIEQEGVRRAWQAIESADRVLWVIDCLADESQLELPLPKHIPVSRIYNKIDLLTTIPANTDNQFYISAKTGQGLNQLRQHLKQSMGYQGTDEGIFSARRRHLDALQRAAQYLDQAAVQLHEYQAGELVAEELRLAQNHLNEITGEFSSDDLLGQIFATFCIGK